MTEVEVIIKTLEDQRNFALTQIVQLKLELHKVTERLAEFEDKILPPSPPETKKKSNG